MATLKCPYCHEAIDEAAFPTHEADHLKLLEDGQQTDHVTLPENEREQGDLTGVPQIYVHQKCGIATVMPEEIVRTYLKNPFTYMADETFCSGCGDYVPFIDCDWAETGENLKTYFDKLRDSNEAAMLAYLDEDDEAPLQDEDA